MIKGLHHNACRCRDSEQTRKFYEDFLGLPLVNSFEIAVEVSGPDLDRMMARGREAGFSVRGISDHGFIDSIYFRDPNGYVLELCAKRPDHDEIFSRAGAGARRAGALASGKALPYGRVTWESS